MQRMLDQRMTLMISFGVKETCLSLWSEGQRLLSSPFEAVAEFADCPLPSSLPPFLPSSLPPFLPSSLPPFLPLPRARRSPGWPPFLQRVQRSDDCLPREVLDLTLDGLLAGGLDFDWVVRD